MQREHLTELAKLPIAAVGIPGAVGERAQGDFPPRALRSTSSAPDPRMIGEVPQARVSRAFRFEGAEAPLRRHPGEVVEDQGFDRARASPGR